MYSQSNEEKIILSYFKDYKGHLLSIGENDGRTFSNALALIERGWTADLVEPSPKAFAKLKDLHKGNNGVWLHHHVISERSGMMEFHESSDTLVSTVVNSEMGRWGNTVTFEDIKVPSLTWRNFLQFSMKQTFDFITIDTEGCELEILSQMDIPALECKMFCVEWNGKNKDLFDKVMEGYRLIGKNAENLIYAL